MSEVVFTFPGKLGDALHQFPVAYHWAKQQSKKADLWLDKKTCGPLVPLFASQPWVGEVKLMEGVESYNCGGQPFHMNLPTSAFEGHKVYHLGLRAFPARQLTLECLQVSKVPVKVSVEDLANEPSLVVPVPAKYNRLMLHGQACYAHTKNSPTFWKFLAGIRGELERMFDEIVFVGVDRDREVGLRTYPNWHAYDDIGDFAKLAGYIAASRAMIACGSAPVVLAGLLKVPSIRVHDKIANDAPKVIWNNLSPSSINDTEIELRKSWPTFRDKWLVQKSVDAEPATT